MIRRAIAFGLWAGTLVLFGIATVVIALTWDIELPEAWGFRGFQGPFAVAASTMGFLVVRRHPHHAAGWTMLVSGTLFGIQHVGHEYLMVSFFALDETLPAAALVGLLSQLAWIPGGTLLVLGLLYFPDGRLASPAWRWVLVASPPIALFVTVSALSNVDLVTGVMRGIPPPYDPGALGPLVTYAQPLYVTGWLLMSVVSIACAVSVAQRFRRSSGVARQQIKWLALAGALTGAAIIVHSVALAWAGTDPTLPAAKPAQYLLVAAITCMPLAIGIAILRHRFLDIDVLISRALVYGTLSATLVATYALAVVLIQMALRPFTAGSDIAVAVSTLTVVALFQPLRRRTQDAVDRRFYRARYDAQRTLDAFADRLRDEVDLGDLRRELIGVVTDTVRPAHASLWLRSR